MRAGHVLIEMLHVTAGLMAAAAIGAAAAWAYPIGRGNIWLVTWVAMGVVVAMGVPPILQAARGGQAAGGSATGGQAAGGSAAGGSGDD